MTDVYTPLLSRSEPTPGVRAVVSAHVPYTTGDYLVPIPFRGRLVHAQTSVTTVVGSGGDMTISIEKDVAGGTSLGTITVAASSSLGAEATASLTSTNPKETLTIDNQDLCLAVTGSASAGEANVFMIFESASGQ